MSSVTSCAKGLKWKIAISTCCLYKPHQESWQRTIQDHPNHLHAYSYRISCKKNNIRHSKYYDLIIRLDAANRRIALRCHVTSRC